MEDVGSWYGMYRISKSVRTTLDVGFGERLVEQQVAEESISTRASGVGVSSIGATRAGRKDPDAGGMPLSFLHS